MSLMELACLGAWGQLCMVWLMLLYAQKQVKPLRPRMSGDKEAVAPAVTVVVPACNEAASITPCIQSILAQRDIALKLVVADDRSSDDTAAVVQAMAAHEPRLKLIRIASLPAGWLGKSHALWRATREVDTPWVLFLDADCKLLDEGAIRIAVDHACEMQADLLTLWPKHDARSWSEAMFIPLCAAVMALWFGRANQPRARAFANGQFILARREAYEAMGGHRSVRSALIEDVPLAQAMRNAGCHTRCANGSALVSVRMYDNLRGVFFGWSRIYIGALRSATKIMLSILWVLVSSALPFAAAIYLMTLSWVTAAPLTAVYWGAVSLCAMHLVLLLLVSMGFWKMGGCDRRYLWLYPISVVGVLAILMHAWVSAAITRRVKWRTTTYQFDRRACVTGATDETNSAAQAASHSMDDLAAGGGDCSGRPAELSHR